MAEIKIIIDHRELKSPTAKHLFEKDISLDPQQLLVGDFILSNDVVCEKKICRDFTASLLDGRLFTQAVELKRNFNKPLIIIEGHIEELYERNISPNAIKAAMISLIIDYQIPIIFSSDPLDTANILTTIAKREQIDNKKEISLRGSKKAFSLSEQQQFLVEGFPSIGPSLAKNLLKHFKSVKNIVNASVEDLQEVEKVGEKKAEIIKKILESEYYNQEI